MVLVLIAWPFTLADHYDSGVWVDIKDLNERVRRSAHVAIDLDLEGKCFNILAFKSHPSLVGRRVDIKHLQDRVISDTTYYKGPVDYRSRIEDRYEDSSSVNPLRLEDDRYVHYLHEAVVNASLLAPGIIPKKGI